MHCLVPALMHARFRDEDALANFARLPSIFFLSTHCWKARGVFNANLAQKADEGLEPHQEHLYRVDTPTHGRV